MTEGVFPKLPERTLSRQAARKAGSVGTQGGGRKQGGPTLAQHLLQADAMGASTGTPVHQGKDSQGVDCSDVSSVDCPCSIIPGLATLPAAVSPGSEVQF